MVDHQFDGALSLMQLKCSGMTTVLELMEHGFPSRALFAELYSMYKEYLPKELKQLEPRTFCEVRLIFSCQFFYIINCDNFYRQCCTV